jgi:hypothetical protein
MLENLYRKKHPKGTPCNHIFNQGKKTSVEYFFIRHKKMIRAFSYSENEVIYLDYSNTFFFKRIIK